MRLVAGKHKGRALVAPSGISVRPTSDKVRESLFNVLAHGGYRAGKQSVLENARVLDAFAGSGALGFESLSRGAAECIFMEKAEAALDAIKKNSFELGEASRVRILRTDVTNPPSNTEPVDLLFIDPPYKELLLLSALKGLLAANWVGVDTVCCAELDAYDEYSIPSKMELLLERRYGRTRIIILKVAC
ncbi:MAG: 16S rRNA (guanine(966)-N(2))-methyltransferase RsmD [Rhodospirillaceae bacterium]|nr:16S rRNA (guanine(966)-N(2))-methyltransferase RsmD [Rhodospirillaceae bacterium]|tara:strand:- start:2905 stop:3471 length:567 start_codon:yes stop_codon:yes gene_type:complete